MSAAVPDVPSVADRADTSLVARLLPTPLDLIFLGCLFVALAAGGRMISSDGDPGRHLAVGEYILSSGAIPRVDVFSHTMAGQPFVPYEWLSEVASAAAFRAAGWAGTVLLHGAAIGAAFALLYRQLRRRDVAVLGALLVTCLAIVASMLHWLARPHVFTFLGTAIFSYVLDEWYAGRLGRRSLWLLPLTTAVWANTHGGFLIGLILLGAYIGADVLRWLAGGPGAAAARHRLGQLAVPALAAPLAALCNPAGPGLLGHVTGYLGKNLLVNRTLEYRSPDFHEANALGFMVVLLATAAALAWSRRRPALHEVLLTLGFTYFALYSARNIPLYALVVAPILASCAAALPVSSAIPRVGSSIARVGAWLGRRNAAYNRMEARGAAGWWCGASVAVLLAIAVAQRAQGAEPFGIVPDPKVQPVDAAHYLADHPPAGNGFNQLVWGGYLLHELWPTERVFIDGQTDFYGEGLTREYLAVVELHSGWRDVLDRHDVRWVIFDTDSPLTRALHDTTGWRVAFEDSVATVLVRGDR